MRLENPVVLVNTGLAFEDQRQHLEGEMFYELSHRVNPLFAERTAWHDDASMTRREWRRFIDEAIEIMLPKFCLCECELFFPRHEGDYNTSLFVRP